MFKANLIKVRDGYHKLKSKQLLYRLLPGVLGGVLGAVFIEAVQIPLWVLITGVGFYAAAVFVLYDNQKLINTMQGSQKIELDQTEVRIKSEKGVIQERINLTEIEGIEISDKYEISREELGDLIGGIRGKTKENYIIVHQNGERKRFDFEFDSNFKLIQLKKVLHFWRKEGYLITREEQESSLPISGYENLTESEIFDEPYNDQVSPSKSKLES